MAHYEEKLSSREHFSGRIFRVTVDDVLLEDGSTSKREIVHHHGGSGVVAVSQKMEVFLVRQFRYAFGKELLEIPAGKLEPGEEPFDAARRELLEECGIEAEHFYDLQPIYPTVGYDNEIIYTYLATGLRFKKARPDDGEFLDLVPIPLDDAIKLIFQGEIVDAKTVVALLKTKCLLDEKKHLFNMEECQDV